jgi:hypothetical protein
MNAEPHQMLSWRKQAIMNCVSVVLEDGLIKRGCLEGEEGL